MKCLVKELIKQKPREVLFQIIWKKAQLVRIHKPFSIPPFPSEVSASTDGLISQSWKVSRERKCANFVSNIAVIDPTMHLSICLVLLDFLKDFVRASELHWEHLRKCPEPHAFFTSNTSPNFSPWKVISLKREEKTSPTIHTQLPTSSKCDL